MLKNTKRTIVVVTTCTLAGMVSSGCTLSGRNLLTLKKKEPAAEVLAESGPTSTFPVPPSSQATPAAIASVAGGTGAPSTGSALPPSQPSRIAGLSASPGYSRSPSPAAPNLAAAQANGIYGNSATKSVGFQTPAAHAKTPSGYTFGNKALTPKDGGSGTAFTMSDMTEETPATASSGFQVPDTNFARPASTGSPSPPAIPQGGFTFPTDETAAAAITPPKTNDGGFVPPAAAAAGDILPPAATSPAFSTASTALEAAVPTAVLPPATTGGSTGFGGYTPGSTGSATGYPSGTEAPATRGSIYR
jgi:hypothetical protein